MARSFQRWFRSKQGKNALILILGAALVLSLLIQLAGPGGLADWLAGTALLDDPYTCLPSCAEDDGRFLGVVDAFGGRELAVWIEVPSNAAAFDLSFFDGDSGLDNAGNVNVGLGNWDNTESELTYTLYADPARDGATETVVGTWQANGDGFANNAWHDLTIDNVEAALTADGAYAYRLVAVLARATGDAGVSAFKLRSTGRLVAGRAAAGGTAIGLVGAMFTRNDIPALYPEFSDEDWSYLGPSNYDGEWSLYLDVPEGTDTLRIWDGDFDRGPDADMAADSDDPNTADELPTWADPEQTKVEGAAGTGDPPDDYDWNLVLRQPPVWYELIGPADSAGRETVFRNDEPSGTEEWEAFVVSTDPAVAADVHVDEIPAGTYELHIGGLDLANIVWLRVDYEVTDRPPASTETAPETTPEPEDPQLWVCRGQPADILYVLDTSSSMAQLYQGSGSKLEAAQQAILTLNDWVAEQNNGSRVALFHFKGPDEGFGNPPIYPPDVALVSHFTEDLRTVNTRLLGLSGDGTKPTARALETVTDLLAGTTDPDHQPVMILITDGVPNVDFDRYLFESAAVAGVDIYEGGTPKSPDAVRFSGEVLSPHGQQAGEPLADTMLAVERLKKTMPELPIYVISVQGASGAHPQIFDYIAEVGGGAVLPADDAQALLAGLHAIYAEQTCETTDLELYQPARGKSNPSTCADYTLTEQARDTQRRVRLSMNNADGSAMVAHNLTVEQWPEDWGELRAVKLFGSSWIDVNTTAPAEVLVSGPQLRGGAGGEVILQFENELPEDVKPVVGYLETISGCRVAFGTAP